jgi:hypothetical protein
LEGAGKGVVMTGAAMLLLGDNPLTPERRFSLRWVWRRHSVAGQVAEFDHLVAVVLSVDSETMRPFHTAASRSSLLTTRSRLRIRYSRRSKTCSWREISVPRRRSSRRAVSNEKSSKE